MKKLIALIFVISSAPMIVLAQGGQYILLENSVIGGATTPPTNFLEYANLIFKTALSITIALAILFIIIGGIQYVLAASSLEKSDGKGKITDALKGLIIALLSWLILYTINPDLVDWKLCIPKLPNTTCESAQQPIQQYEPEP